jgi:hypothetical protein
MALTMTARADEGMWLFNAAPVREIASRYGVSLDDAWLEHVRKSSVRISTGGSGSIVSADGLVMTNHHVASDLLAKLSTKDRDLLETGFYAKTRDQELKCPDLELDVLWTIEDVTSRVNQGVNDDTPAAEAGAIRRRNIATIEDACKKDTGLEPQVVTLYQGGQYHLYGYKRYTDVRMVFAPEQQAAFFGGDTDNFEYPRYCLDVSFLRIYEDGKPLKPEHYLKWTEGGLKEGDPIFISGHPGTTRRLYTMDHLRMRRDMQLPSQLSRIWRSEVKYQNFMARNAENHRIAKDDYFGIANGRKALTGQLAGLLDPGVMKAKAEQERTLREAVDRKPEWRAKWGGAWADIAGAEEVFRKIYDQFVLFEAEQFVGGSSTFGIARTLVRLPEEDAKPNGERLREFTDAARPSLELELYSPAPIYPDLEVFKVASGLSLMAEMLGGDHPLVQKVLAGKSPEERAHELVSGTSLFDVEQRGKLAGGGADAIASSDDPMIQLARLIDDEARSVRKTYEDDVQAVERGAYAKVAAAKFAVLGDSVYPDATFTLRLSYGAVKGYDEGGQKIPAFTTIGGTFDRLHERLGQEGFTLPNSWLSAQNRLNKDTPFNFVCTGDIIGGNSGSPIVGAQGEVVGLVFDGNIQSLVYDTAYTDAQARTVAVDARGILEALDKVYGAKDLVREIKGK